MKFTYDGYCQLLGLLKDNQYEITSYEDSDRYDKCVILRHDVDNCLERALTFARLEAREGVKSTYFIMLSSPFYNIASKHSIEIVKEINSLGHDIGLHFDEVKYQKDDIVSQIQKEALIMEMILDIPIKSVSMHRPSKETLEADYSIKDMVNSYGKKFFKEYKYLSDSRRNWREDVLDIVTSGEHEKLHILTHAFWYEKEEMSIKESLKAFVQEGVKQRYVEECENIRDFEEIVSLEECYENFVK